MEPLQRLLLIYIICIGQFDPDFLLMSRTPFRK